MEKGQYVLGMCDVARKPRGKMPHGQPRKAEKLRKIPPFAKNDYGTAPVSSQPHIFQIFSRLLIACRKRSDYSHDRLSFVLGTVTDGDGTRRRDATAMLSRTMYWSAVDLLLLLYTQRWML